MLSRWGTILGIVFASIASNAQAEDRIVSGIPLPQELSIQAVPASVSAPAKLLSGVWIGSWDGELRHILVVESISPDGNAANVLYAVGDKPDWGIRRSWVRHSATISGDALIIGDSPPVTYKLEASGSLQATYRQGTRRSYARLTRVPIESLAAPSTALRWSEPMTNFVDGPVEDGKTARLELLLLAPPGPGPFPLLVFNHGSTGTGRDPGKFTRSFQVFGLADFFVSRGWMVAFPQRRGRGRSEGLYDEGFEVDRKEGYTCDAEVSLRGAERALADIETAVAALRTRSDVAPGPIMIGGQSRGGALAVAFAGRHPDLITGVVNFVGGWMGTGCSTAAAINGALFREGGRFPRPTLWLYGHHDPYYSVGHSRANFEAFRHAGGRGRFLAIDVPSGDGHALIYDRDLWGEPMSAYLNSIAGHGPE